MSREVRIQFRYSRRPWRKVLRREYWFRLVAANGKVLCSSEGYARKEDCVHAAALVHNSVIVYDPLPKRR